MTDAFSWVLGAGQRQVIVDVSSLAGKRYTIRNEGTSQIRVDYVDASGNTPAGHDVLPGCTITMIPAANYGLRISAPVSLPAWGTYTFEV